MSEITLRRFSIEFSDLILSWRNQPHVRANSLSNSEISSSDHLDFLGNLKSRPDLNYFLLCLDGRPEAVLNINLDGSTGLWGCYTGSLEVRPGLFPMLVATAGALAFGAYGCNELNSEVLASNAAPQQLNKFLGVPPVGERQEMRTSGETIDVCLYSVTDNAWPGIRARIDKILTSAQRDAVQNMEVDPRASIR